MAADGSVSRWLGPLQGGDPAAAQQLWDRYFTRLVGLARAKLAGQPRRAADEEDVALSAFASLCYAAQRGRLPRLQDRHDLWRVLVALTTWKVQRLARDERRQKRGGAVLDEAAWPYLEQVVSREPSPEFAAEVAEECERLLHLLPNAELRSIARWKLEGDTTAEIAAKLHRAPRSVERKLQRIRVLWREEFT